MYRIGMFSKINKVTVKTLRYYDEVGLLIPAYVDEENGYRYYTSNQLPIIHKIKALRQMGFTIDEITLIIKGIKATEIFENRKKELEKAIEESNKQASQINYYLDNLVVFNPDNYSNILYLAKNNYYNNLNIDLLIEEIRFFIDMDPHNLVKI